MKKRILCVVLSFILCFSAISVSAETLGETATRYLVGILDIIEKNYKFDVDKETLYEAVIKYLIGENPEDLEGALRAATKVLDKHSEYFDQSELVNFVESVYQTYVGIGVTVQKSENGCIVMEINKSGGAHEAGIIAGDEIIAVGTTDISDIALSDIVTLIQGAPGTVVTIGILRNGSVLTLDITRKNLSVQTVSYEITDGIGYIKIDSFADETASELSTALSYIEKEHGIKKMIIDVRDNPGGELSSVIKVLSQFVPKNKLLVKFEYKNEKHNYSITSDATFTKAPRREIVILANESSASASELFCGTMQYYKLAKIVGNTTYGKGCMQEMLGIIDPPNIELGDIKLTLAEFLKPDGGKINGIGIDPDIFVKNKFKAFDSTNLTPMTISARYTIGDEAQDVLAIEERLAALGYNVGAVDGVYDNLTYQATKNFQATASLHPYGVMDYTTQSVLNDVISDLEVEIDLQKERAFEILK